VILVTTTIQQMTIRALVDAARRFNCGDMAVQDGDALNPRDVSGWAAVVSIETRKGKVFSETIDGNHRAAGLLAWAEECDGMDELVPVVVTDDSALVRAILDRKDAGRDDVDDLIEASLE
jgi:hypothetical protein